MLLHLSSCLVSCFKLTARYLHVLKHESQGKRTLAQFVMECVIQPFITQPQITSICLSNEREIFLIRSHPVLAGKDWKGLESSGCLSSSRNIRNTWHSVCSNLRPGSCSHNQNIQYELKRCRSSTDCSIYRSLKASLAASVAKRIFSLWEKKKNLIFFFLR